MKGGKLDILESDAFWISIIVVAGFTLLLVLVYLASTKKMGQGMAIALGVIAAATFIGLLAINEPILAQWLTKAFWPWLAVNWLTLLMAIAGLVVLIKIGDMENFLFFGLGAAVFLAGVLVVGNSIPNTIDGLQAAFKDVSLLAASNRLGLTLMLIGLALTVMSRVRPEQLAGFLSKLTGWAILLGLLAGTAWFVLNLADETPESLARDAAERLRAAVAIPITCDNLPRKGWRKDRQVEFSLRQGQMKFGQRYKNKEVLICASGQGKVKADLPPYGPDGDAEINDGIVSECPLYSLIVYDANGNRCNGASGRSFKVYNPLKWPLGLYLNEEMRYWEDNQGSWRVVIWVRDY